MFACISRRRPRRHRFAGPSWRHLRARWRAPAGFLIVAVLISACGNGALRGPSPSPRTSATGSSSSISAANPRPSATGNAAISSPSAAAVLPTSPATTRQQSYSYSLPYGDTGYAQPDEAIYSKLLNGDCASAQENLDKNWWRLGIGGPREVVMMQVAIDLCRNDRSAADDLFTIAEARYGQAGLGYDVWSCNIYRAARSYLRQVPLESPKTACTKKEHIPLWPGNRYFPSEPVQACEDPRFGTGTCAGPAPSVTPTTPLPSPPTAPAGSSSPAPATSAPARSMSASSTS
jgi:hypothetical protein